MLGTRSPAESRRMGSTSNFENANAFSCTALRSFSNSTITMDTPSNICGTGPSKSPPNRALNCPKTINTAQNNSENESAQNATDPLRRQIK